MCSRYTVNILDIDIDSNSSWSQWRLAPEQGFQVAGVHAWLPDALFFTRSRAGGQETKKEEKKGQIVEWMFLFMRILTNI